MNRIYRRIWNHAKGCWEVASELTTPCGRKSSRATGAGGLLVIALLLVGGDAHAKTRYYIGCDPFNLGNGEFVSCSPITGSYEDSTFIGYALSSGRNSLGYGAGVNMKGDNTTAFGIGARISGQNSAAFGFKASTYAVDSVAVGYNARTSADGGHNVAVGANAFAAYIGATALGNKAEARAQNAIALGSGSSSRGVDALSLGANSSTSAAGSMAVGAKSSATRTNAIALGLNAVAQQENAVALGASTIANGVGGVALGAKAMVDTGAGTGGVAIGGGARAGSLGYTGAIAIGGESRAYTDSIALGYAASASAQGAVALGVRSVATEANTVSVGSASVRRRIVNVADARITASSTDAVTGKQLHAMNERVDGMIKQDSGGGVVRIANSNTGSEVSMRNAVLATRKVSGVSDGALTTTSTEAVNGRQLTTTNGNVAKAQTAADVAKADASKALAQVTTVTGLIGQTSSTSSVRLGEKNSGTSLDVRNSANANRKVTGVADATLSTSSTEAVTGRQLNATNENVAKAQTAAGEAKSDASKALTQVVTLGGLVGQVSATGNVRLGEKNSGTVLDVRNSANASRKLTGVAEGTLSTSSTEAVTGRQLNTTNENVVKAQTAADTAKMDAGKALAQAVTLGGLVAQVSATGNVRLGEKNSGTVLDVSNSANMNRRISGLADGQLSATSVEAVSGRQLYETNFRVSAIEKVSQYVSIGSDAFSRPATAGLLGVAIGDSAIAGIDGGTAVGAFATALGINSVAVGRGSGVSATSDNGFALGAGAQVHAEGGIAVGAGAIVQAGAVDSLAFGAGSGATEAGTASFGTATTQRRLVNIARGTADHNAATVSQLKDSLATLGGGAGMDASGNIIAPTYSVQSGTQSTVEDALMALDGAVITAGRRAGKVEDQLSSIFQDTPSARADGMNQIALSGVNGMVLTNLADGRVAPGSRDAVTGSQLYAAEQKISQNRNDLDAMRREREMGQEAIRGLDASVIDYGGARLTGVAEAKLSADSSDAVRGSQLFSTNTRLNVVEGKAEHFDFGSSVPELEWRAPRAGRAGVAVGEAAVASPLTEGAVAVGFYASAHGENSVALGRAAWVQADADHGFALGTRSLVEESGGIAFGAGSLVRKGALSSVAVGNSSVADESQTVSFGGGLLRRRLVNIANGTANHNAATVGQLRGALSALGSEVDANGNIVGPSFTVQGQSQSTLNGALEALDGAVVSNRSRVNQVESQLRSVFQDTPSVRADGLNQLTLAGTHGMVISNVANGLVAAGSRDAVNGGQLHSMQQQLNGRMDGLEQRIDAPQPLAMAVASVPEPEAPVPQAEGGQQVASAGEGEKPTPQPKTKKEDTPKPQVDTAELEKMLARANEYTDGAISNFERRLDKMDKRFKRMAAMSSAQTAMAMNTAGLATYNRLGAGVGYSEGESAMAVGYQRVLNEKGSATFSLNGAFTNSGERSMGVGVGIGW
ncbi:ESPR-type extended signal peptide-containing protein [Stenotrophomonas maltophilia]|uniref:ESPR-type extended signal peptide-containing protein n=1 Tax=Stenotrophomonas maltophilia TaxID=40324 RepID=UPI00244C4D9B|nr:ESPR-type extended signal peptide-containing protein [Stenotrophomonas maltophilia]MDH0074130.1 ESPR-type extended signal peptide-containing protein [Stenotrophomonas maltophilia]MDH0107081.1 ESPR-type extended signal peptide-containing protein [Stenotrophomonas maltophilia]MDH0332124.1 ESPR-type extended signal peptide-containing protein [Stenotrophomonas maltophilia]MDH0653292.1 ESPR-type extended signal peptide-containing protein [Stenotrophomonas maltophilia]MDH0742702.1 ESPR-type exten